MFFCIFCLLAFISTSVALLQLLLLVRARKPGLPLYPHPLLSPFCVVFSSRSLTPEGLRIRRFLVGSLVFAAIFSLIAILSGISEHSMHLYP